MRWKMPNGKLVWKNDKQYLTDWSKPAKSKISQSVQDFLKENTASYIWYSEYRVPGTRLKIDYLCPSLKIAIEVQGRQHENYVEFFHKSRTGYLAHIKRDVKKEKFLESNDYTLILIYDKDLPLTKNFFLKTYNINI